MTHKCSCEQMLREHLVLRTKAGEQMTGYQLFRCEKLAEQHEKLAGQPGTSNPETDTIIIVAVS